MGVHITVVGNGRIGRPTTYTIFNDRLASEFSLVDIKPGLAWAFGEELKHVAASLSYDVKINAYEDEEGPFDSDIVIVCPGKPRVPGVNMDRRELVASNARIINHIAEVMPNRNPNAKWVIITNPVDAMATLFKKVSGAKFVISTGDHPDTLRMKTIISEELGVPITKISGFVGGEHGSAAYPLWSTVSVEGLPIDVYLEKNEKELSKDTVVEYVRGVSKKVVDIIGGTEVGPAAGFRDLIRSIVEDRGEMYSFAQTNQLPGIPEPVHVSIPTTLGKNIGPNIWDQLTTIERANIIDAGKAIYANYKTSLEACGKV